MEFSLENHAFSDNVEGISSRDAASHNILPVGYMVTGAGWPPLCAVAGPIRRDAGFGEGVPQASAAEGYRDSAGWPVKGGPVAQCQAAAGLVPPPWSTGGAGAKSFRIKRIGRYSMNTDAPEKGRRPVAVAVA